MMTEDKKQALIERLNKLAEGLKWNNVAYAQDVLSAVAALTQPGSPALKLPDLKAAEEVFRCLYSGRALSAAINAAKWYEEEAKRLNAPHTAPIEPIFATGGAEWVKCCDGKPDIDVTVWCYGQYDDGSDDTDNYAFPGYMDKKGRWFACNNGDYVDGGYGNDYRACVARWMSLPAAPEEE